jgi:hypothetical protein
MEIVSYRTTPQKGKGMLYILCISFTALAIYTTWFNHKYTLPFPMEKALSILPLLTILLDAYYIRKNIFSDSSILLLAMFLVLICMFFKWVVFPMKGIKKILSR